MTTAHLTDAELQLYVAEPGVIDEPLKTHVQSCTHCQAKAANYQLLFLSIQDNIKPKFDFDLTTLVLQQLPEPKPAFPWMAMLIAGFSFLLIALSSVFFWSTIAAVIRNSSTVVLIAAVTTAFIILIFQAIEMFNNHQKQIRTLLNSKTLQL